MNKQLGSRGKKAKITQSQVFTQLQQLCNAWFWPLGNLCRSFGRLLGDMVPECIWSWKGKGGENRKVKGVGRALRLAFLTRLSSRVSIPGVSPRHVEPLQIFNYVKCFQNTESSRGDITPPQRGKESPSSDQAPARCLRVPGYRCPLCRQG